MNGFIDYFFVGVIFIGCGYAFFKQIQYTIEIIKSIEKGVLNRVLVGNLLTSLAFAGFLISLTLNMFVYYGVYNSQLITSYNTALSAFLFLIILFIAKFKIAPSKIKHNRLTY